MHVTTERKKGTGNSQFTNCTEQKLLRSVKVKEPYLFNASIETGQKYGPNVKGSCPAEAQTRHQQSHDATPFYLPTCITHQVRMERGSQRVWYSTVIHLSTNQAPFVLNTTASIVLIKQEVQAITLPYTGRTPKPPQQCI